MNKKSKFQILKEKINNLLESVTEEVPDITDNGLTEDSLSRLSNSNTMNNSIEKESKGFFGKSKEKESVVNTLAQASSTEVSSNNNSLTQLLKSTPGTNIDPVIDKVETNITMETFPVYNDSVETSEMSKEDLFAHKLSLGDNIIEGYADTCYDTVEAIYANDVISEKRKAEKATEIEEEFLAISPDDRDSMIIFYKKLCHELHMIDNKVGEYDSRVYENGLISDARIKNYNIIQLHMSEDLHVYECREDKDAINKLLDMCEEIHRRARACNCLNNYLSKTEELLMTCSTILDLATVEEKYEHMLMDLNVKINTSSNNASLHA